LGKRDIEIRGVTINKKFRLAVSDAPGADVTRRCLII
jgi:hypothetical protein